MIVCATAMASRAQNPVAEQLRRAAVYAEAMHPTGLLALPVLSTATLNRLQRAPDLQRAVSLVALDLDGTPPFRLDGAFTLDGEFGGHRTGTVEADRYNDRWSHLTVTLEGVRSTIATLDGRRVADEGISVLPFDLDRLLRAVFDPLGGAVGNRGPLAFNTSQQDGVALHCTTLPNQPVPDAGLTPTSRSVWVDAATGDLRVDIPGYGVRLAYRNLQPLGKRRIATDIQVIRENRIVGELHLRLRIAGDLTPQAYAAFAALPQAREPHMRFHATPGQMHHDLETLDVHLIPLDDEALKRRVPMAVARVLADREGHVTDVEFMGDTPPDLRERAVRVLRRSIFRRREWRGQPISEEGLLLLGAP